MSNNNNNNKNSGKLVLVIFMLVGIFMLIGGIVMTVNRKNKEDYYGSVKAKVTDIQQSRKDGKTTYTAVYTYYVDDVEYTCTDDRSSRKCPHRGDVVDIKYDPSNPADAYVSGRIWPGVILLGMGILFAMAASLGFINSGEGTQTLGRKFAGELLMGIMVSFMGWGILIAAGDEIGVISFPGIVLCIFGVLGLYVIYRSIRQFVTAKKNGVGADGRKPKYTAWDSYHMENDRSEPTENRGDFGYQPDESNSQAFEIPQDNPVSEFYSEHKETINKTVDVVRKGQSVMSCIVMIFVGAVFTLTSLPMISISAVAMISGGNVTSSNVIAVIMGIVFLVVGIKQIINGIKSLKS